MKKSCAKAFAFEITSACGCETDEASISEKLAAVKMGTAENDDDSEERLERRETLVFLSICKNYTV